jgi:outer membrane cobalamin receptor
MTKRNLLIALFFIGFNSSLLSQGEGDTSQIDRIDEVRIKQNRLKEKLKESALTVESMTAQSIKETPASDFYEALGHLKGVDVTSASLGFRIVNTRGFNSTSPVRTLQVIDGVDNQSPGLNFSLGNFLGASELDVAGQEIVVGASSSYYGPGAFNGVISMTTKDPWKTPGFSYKFKMGERQLMENSLRYAKVFYDKKHRELFAFKTNFYYMQAYDWVADNQDPVQDSKVARNNPGGYDAINKYGDEVLRPGEYDQTSVAGMYDVPGLNRYFRDGYWEKDLVDYNTYNLKTSAAFAAKPFKDKRKEFIYQINFGMGTTVYQGDNRYSLNDIQFLQNRIEYKHKNGFIRAYATHEDAGNTYDAVFTALLMQQATKPDDLWGGDYQNYWRNKIKPQVKKLPGYPNFFPADSLDLFKRMMDDLVNNNIDQFTQWHNEARAKANSANDFRGIQHPFDVTYNRFQPGSERFDSLKNAITSRKSFGEGGSGFYDKSALYNFQAEHNFDLGNRHKLKLGVSGRLYTPNSAGTIFSDTNGRVITNTEAGAYAGYEKKYMKDKLKMNATFRVDKNVNFPFVYSPALSFVYTPDKITYYRLSLTSGVRNPTLADQYLYYNVGRAILLGNIKGYQNLVTMESLNDYFLVAQPDLSILKYFDVAPVVPEKVKSIEVGYKAFLFKNKLNIDFSAYYSYYEDFIGYKIGFDPFIDPTINKIMGGQVYRIATNAETPVTTQGTSIGLNYFFGDYYTIGFNHSYNQLNKQDNQDPIIPAFNTPRHKFNLSLSGSQMKVKNVEQLSFNINFKWVEGFVFEGSPQFTGNISSYYLIDAMVAKEIPKYHLQCKLGASNLTNNMVMQVYGGPRIGRMAYFSVLYDLPTKANTNTNK